MPTHPFPGTRRVPRFPTPLRGWVVLSLLATLLGCGALPSLEGRPESRALPDTEATPCSRSPTDWDQPRRRMPDRAVSGLCV